MMFATHTQRRRNTRWQFCIFVILSMPSNIAHAANPRPLHLNTAVGPDGPWNALIQLVSWPEKNVTLLPALTKSNLFIGREACTNPVTGPACFVPQSTLWTGEQGDFSWMNSSTLDASAWDTSLEPLNLAGQGTMISDRITLRTPDRTDSFLDFTAVTIDHDFTVHYPSTESWYTLNTGFFSLYGGDAHVNYTSVNGSDVSLYTTLAGAYDQTDIPSMSYGLHIGSASDSSPIAGSLVLGGYDKSRCLTEPIVSDTNTFNLTDISLGVAKGGSPFPKTQNLPITGLLQKDGKAIPRQILYPNAGVPYLHLSADTCAAIASHLPVTFDSSLGLYLWNTSAPSYHDIITSPTYISFTFSSSASSQPNTIYVPFTLLNLTLENPLVTTPTQYFPCSPYTPSDGQTYHLGRAFLQAAFLAQNWQTKRLMLAQAPGPDFSEEIIVAMTALPGNDTGKVAMINAPSWNATWASTLKPLAGDIESTKPSSNVSNGAIAGIVVGVVVLLAAVILGVVVVWRRRRARAARAISEKDDIGHGSVEQVHHPANSYGPAEVWAPGKYVLTQSPVEMGSTCINELDGRTFAEK